MNAVVPSIFPVVRRMDETQNAANIALAAQYKVGYRAGWREAWLCIGVVGMCCFVGGAVFAAGVTALVSAVLS